MDKISTWQTRSMTDRRRMPVSGPVAVAKSRALTVYGKPNNGRPAAMSTNPNRRFSAILAQLALQYDTRDDRRVRRALHLNAAISGYGAEQRMSTAAQTRSRHDFKI